MNGLLASGAALTGVTTFFLGLIVVFAGIAVLVAVIYIIGKILGRTKKEKPKAEETEPDDTVDAVNAAAASQTADGDIPPHIRAVITAAIYACLEKNDDGCEFIVRKITRRS